MKLFDAAVGVADMVDPMVKVVAELVCRIVADTEDTAENAEDAKVGDCDTVVLT